MNAPRPIATHAAITATGFHLSLTDGFITAPYGYKSLYLQFVQTAYPYFDGFWHPPVG